MRKYDHKAKKIEKSKNSHSTLDNFYSKEQKQEEHKKDQEKRHKKTQHDIEMEIFEHLKNHTKKVLKSQK